MVKRLANDISEKLNITLFSKLSWHGTTFNKQVFAVALVVLS
jgi:hypothetical protein